MKSVTTRVPATTANLGPGFDCLGVALDIANNVTVQRAEGGEHPKIVADAAALFFRTAGIDPFGFAWSIEGEVPQSRGLGSSVTVRLGLLHGLDARLAAETGMPIVIANNPLHSVAIGSGQCLEEFEALKQVLISSSSR